MLHNRPANNLNHVLRFSGSPIDSEETVAQHVAGMQFLAIELYNEFLNQGKTLDIGTIMYKIAIHDLDECILGDIPRPIKYMSDKSLAFFEEVSRESITNKYGEIIYNDVKNAKSHETIEGWVVDLLDSLQCVYRLRLAVSISERFRHMLDEAIEVSMNKLAKLKESTLENSDLLYKICYAELRDTSV